MSTLLFEDDPHRLGHHVGVVRHEAPGHGAGGPASKRIIAGYGFWLFLLSDVIIFASFFAAYAVLWREVADGPGPRQIFHPTSVALQTAFLLASSFACGMASLAFAQRNLKWTEVALTITGLLGLGFLLLEAREFSALVARGAGPSRSAFLSSFFTLVGCHGAHVSAGLLWLGTMQAQVWAKGFRRDIRHRFLCFTLFWHALDIIWVGIFSLVYLVGITA